MQRLTFLRDTVSRHMAMLLKQTESESLKLPRCSNQYRFSMGSIQRHPRKLCAPSSLCLVFSIGLLHSGRQEWLVLYNALGSVQCIVHDSV